MAEPALDDMLEQLYAADPSDFIALRKQLQGELRAAGLKPEAALLAKARRPTTAMWAVNQLVRRQPALVESLLERSEALRAAQTKALRGERDAMRDAMRAHRTAVDAALDAALGILGPRANDGFRDEIAVILRAASAQPEIGRELRAGRLVRTDDTTPGFPDLGDVVPEPLPAPAKPRRGRTKQPRASEATPATQTREAEQAEREAQEAREAQAEAARQARREWERARDEAAAADAAVADTEQRIAELSTELAGARRDLKTARAEQRTARAEADRLARDVKR
jgi:hypothetical protein